MTQRPDRTALAALLIVCYAMVIGYTDNYVRVIAAEAGIWQFHMARSVMALCLLVIAARVWQMRLRPLHPRAVLARSALHAFAMLIYFGSLAFLPVAIVAAGLFTAPIFVLLISRIAFGQRISALQAAAVAIGFFGVLLILGPQSLGNVSLAAVLPVLAGAMYAMGNVTTRAWCAGESAETLLAGFFVMLGLVGAVGMVVLALHPVAVPDGTDGFLQRGPVWPSSTFLWWTFVQAAGSLFAVGLMIRGYQMTDVRRASVIEYAILPASAFWGWLIWGQTLNLTAIAGMVLIVVAGVLIVTQSPRTAA